jgi:type IV pilus assembly protein PilC
VVKDVQSGLSLADSLGKYPSTFSLIYVNMVRAGETGGILDDILKKLATQQEKDATIRAKVKSATTYPLVLLQLL